MDYLKSSVVAVIAGMAVTLLAALFIAWENRGSSNIGLATGTLGAAMLLFGLQLVFQLRGTDVSDVLSTEFTVDRQTPQIRSWRYTTAMAWRISTDTGASEWLARTNPVLFVSDGDQETLTRDMTLHSLLAYIGSEQPDWQMESRRYVGSTGITGYRQGISQQDECRYVEADEFRDLLRSVGNVLADSGRIMLGPRICMPPGTRLTATRDSLVLENPFCRVTFKIALSGGVSRVEPRSGGQVVTLPDGQARYNTRPVGIAMTVRYFGIRAQHADAAKYRAWVDRLLTGAHTWFELQESAPGTSGG